MGLKNATRWMFGVWLIPLEGFESVIAILIISHLQPPPTNCQSYQKFSYQDSSHGHQDRRSKAKSRHNTFSCIQRPRTGFSVYNFIQKRSSSCNQASSRFCKSSRKLFLQKYQITRYHQTLSTNYLNLYLLPISYHVSKTNL